MKRIITTLLLILPICIYAQKKGGEPVNDQDDLLRTQTIAEDLVVQGSECVGIDCVSTESFGFDTERFKENNLRLHFDDTSASGSFPGNDWRILINETANGGQNYFAIEDATAGTIPVIFKAGAGNNALYVSDSGGNVGLGNSSPVVELHVTDGDSPTLRLEQDASNGWTPQTWDLASNETNFFIRDVTGGSKLPFKIKPGAPDNAIFIAANGSIGMGTASPGEPLHIANTTPSIRLDSPTNDWSLRIDGAEFKLSDLTTGTAPVVVTTAAPDDSFFMNALGNVAIGGDAPAYKLDVTGTIQSTGFKMPTGAQANYVLTSDADGLATWQENVLGDTDWTISGSDIHTTDLTGNVGIGTETPLHKLHVEGDIAKTGSLIGISDQRIKTNISSVTGALAIVNSLDGKTYDFKTEQYPSMDLPQGKQYGLIAQDVEKVLEDLVRKKFMQTIDENGETIELNGVNYEQLIPILINAIKEQDKTIQNLTKNSKDTEARLAALEAKLIE